MDLRLSEFIIRKFIKDGQEYFFGKKQSESGQVAGVRMVDCERIRFAGRIKEGENKEYMAEVEFNIKGEPVSCDCSCGKESRCRHAAALMFEIMKTKGRGVGSLSTNYVASKNMLNLFEKHRLGQINKLIVASTGKLKLEPRLYFEKGRIEMELYIAKRGRRKNKIDDIFEFISLTDRNNGSNMREYKYNAEGFTSEGKALLNFVFDRYEVKTGFIALSNLTEDRGRLIIKGADLDGLFELLLNRNVEAVVGDELCTIKLSDEEPYARLMIEGDDGKASLKRNFKTSGIYISNSYGYVLLNKCLYRTSAEYGAIIKDIDDSFNIAESEEIVFGANDLTGLVDFVVPMLIRHGLLENEGRIYKSLSMTPFTGQIYIENVGKQIVANVKFIYGDTIIDYNDKNSYREYRNDRAESFLRLMLEGMGFEDRGTAGFVMTGNEQIFEFLKFGLKALGRSAEVYLSNDLKRIRKTVDKTVKVGARYDGKLVEMDFDIKPWNFEELRGVFSAYDDKKSFYRFSDGSFISIKDNEAFLKFLRLFNVGKKEAENGSFTVNSAAIIAVDSVFDDKEKRFLNVDKLTRHILDKFSDLNIADYKIPPFYENLLRDYQKKGFKWLKTIGECGFGGILADDMGLGKTIQFICFLNDRYLTETKPSLVVCPTSLIFNWEAELERFGGGLNYAVVYGDKGARAEILKEDRQLFITSYETLKRDIDIYREMDFAVLAADEAQFIKNHDTKNFEAISSLKTDVRFALTGTPFENRLGELWSLFDFIMPGYLGKYRSFSTNFEKPIMKNNDVTKMNILKKFIMPFVLRREKGEVLRDLPEKSEYYSYTPMTEEQHKLYMAQLLHARGIIEADYANNEMSRIKILKEITRLRQICCHPSLFLPGYKGESGKLNYVMENISGLLAGGHNVILFSQFTSMLEIIKNELMQRGIEFFYLDGHTPPGKRIEYVNLFNSSKGGSIFLISLKAGGTGLNLTGADIVLHYDQWWNPAVMEQAADRAHRFGQVRRVQVYNIITKGTIEEKILKLQSKKKQLFNEVFDLEDHIIENITKEELLELFS